MADPEISERRRYVRVDAKVIAWYRTEAVPTGGSDALGALTKNLSAGGVLFETDEAIPVGAHLDVEMKLPGSPKIRKSVGRVARLEALGGGRYDVGIAFERIPDEDKEAIETYVKGLA